MQTGRPILGLFYQKGGVVSKLLVIGDEPAIWRHQVVLEELREKGRAQKVILCHIR